MNLHWFIYFNGSYFQKIKRLYAVKSQQISGEIERIFKIIFYYTRLVVPYLQGRRRLYEVKNVEFEVNSIGVLNSFL